MVKAKIRSLRVERARQRRVERQLDSLTDYGFLDRISDQPLFPPEVEHMLINAGRNPAPKSLEGIRKR